MDIESMKKASAVYFHMLKKKMIEDSDELYNMYFEPTVRESVRMLADQSGTQVIEAHKRLHLIAKAGGSVFATNFTHLRSRHKDIENKKHFYAVSIVIMAFMAEIDRNQAAKIKTRREGVTFFMIERAVTSLMDQWEVKIAQDSMAEKRSGLAMRDMVTLWKNLEPESERGVFTRPNKKTRMGLIKTAFKLLEDEGLVYIADRDQPGIKAFPSLELFDRLEYLYGDQDRYEEIKSIVARQEESYA
ncbi:DUF6063 family protein [Paenibacillus sp. B01]|uniref:DUF6063 family protein n=1 Tax=Paenibacillus sp. B01 TaxID=2660554 RepID=UPI00129BF6D9|nr:DUF6063 family protein [Paenibacillus sp. B01]QGG57832.1 hypothetical protein GE073_21195 [Paenibacillus sp. B01]